jgi:hypothetical protein
MEQPGRREKGKNTKHKTKLLFSFRLLHTHVIMFIPRMGDFKDGSKPSMSMSGERQVQWQAQTQDDFKDNSIVG